MTRRVELTGRTNPGFRIWMYGVGNVMASDENGNVGIGTSGPGSKLEVDGTATAASVWETSARRFKTNVEPLENTTALVEQLRGMRYWWKESGKPDVGFVAEEVEKVLPCLISHTENGRVKGLNYSHLTAGLVEALKEQVQRTDSLSHMLREERSRNQRQQNRLERQQRQIEGLRSVLQTEGINIDTSSVSSEPDTRED